MILDPSLFDAKKDAVVFSQGLICLALVGSVCLPLAAAAETGGDQAKAHGAIVTPAPSDIGRYEPVRAASDVTVDGQQVHVYSLMRAGLMDSDIPVLPTNFAQIELAAGHNASIHVSYRMAIKSAVVRPLSAGIKPLIDGTTIRFEVTRPGQYVLEVNDAISRPSNDNSPLVMIADKQELDPPTGPAVTVFPTGRVTTLPHYKLIAQPNHTYVIPAGAVVRGLIAAEGAAGVKVTGHGILLYDQDVFAHYISEQLQQLSPVFAWDAPDFAVSGITVMTATNQFTRPAQGGDLSPWAVHIIKSPRSRLTGVKIFNQLLDGIELDGVQDGSVTGSFVQSADDTLGIKAACYGFRGGGAGSNPHHILFEDDETNTTGPGQPMQITELNSANATGRPCGASTPPTTDVSDIIYRHIDVMHPALRTSWGIHASQGGVLSIQNAYTTRVHAIRYEGIVVEDMPKKDYLARFDLTPQPALYGPQPGGAINDVQISDFRVSYDKALNGSAPANITMPGYSSSSVVSDVRFDRFFVNGVHISAAGAKADANGVVYDGLVRLSRVANPARSIVFR